MLAAALSVSVFASILGVLAALRTTDAWIYSDCRVSTRLPSPHFPGIRLKALAFSQSPSCTGGVSIYDGVISNSACDEFDRHTKDHSLRSTNSDGSSIFFRSETGRGGLPLTPLEQAIDSILTALGDEYPIVEYWSRSEYLNLDAHADIDEGHLESEGLLRYPQWAHVLYLDVEDGVRGPTCVFSDKLGGWDILPPTGDDGAPVRGEDASIVKLVTIPAVKGRMLRFGGRAMHAVPRPADRWLLSDEHERWLRLEVDNSDIFAEDDEFDNDEDLWLEDDFDDDNHMDLHMEQVRSVLLFNTWRDIPPRGVDRNPATGALPSGIELSDGGENEHFSEITEEIFSKPILKEPILQCNDVSAWKKVVPFVTNIDDIVEGESNIAVRVHLMGSEKRRVHPSKSPRLLGPVSLQNALNEEIQVSVFHLVKDELIK